MKKIILFTFLFISIKVIAADWDLFPYQQKGYFIKNTSYAVNKIGVHIMDSVKTVGQESVLFFNRKLNLEGAGNCYDEAVNFVMSWGGIYNSDFIDSLIVRNDTLFYHHNLNATQFYFLLNSQPGDSWSITTTYSSNTFNQITITCISAQPETFLGITDSVKTYSLTPNATPPNQTPISNFQIKLSKSYGLIEYVPFYLFMYHPSSENFYDLKLIGLEKNNINYGYIQPKFEDYFHLSVGDILLWHRHVDPDAIPFPEYHEYYRDSIIQSIISGDSVYYVFNRTKKDSGNVITQINNLSVTYKKSGFKYIIGSLPKWIGFGHNMYNIIFSFSMPIWYTDYLEIKIDTITGDTIHQFAASSGWHYIDTISCIGGWVTDQGYDFIVDTHAGITKHCMSSFGSDCTTLIAYKIDGIQTGSLSLGINDFEISYNPLLIFPNPASNYIQINLKNYNNTELKIYDVLGKLIKQKSAIDNNEIDISLLNPGIYFVKILTGKEEFAAKLVKQ